MSVKDLFRSASANTILAPMAGYTDAPFRSFCADFGAGLTVTEMVSAKALVMNNQLTHTLLKTFPSKSPCFVQIFGHEPQVMAQCVQLPEMQKFDGVDINMGCPVKKIVSNGDGSALMEDVKLASQCISAVKKAVGNKPLSVKFRLGVQDGSGVADFSKMCADSGADFVTVHFRTRKQMYSGQADYSFLPQVVKCGIPVFANGDVSQRSQYLQLTSEGAFGVAVGRASLGRPYVFSQIADIPYTIDVWQTIQKHIAMLLQYMPERVVNNEMKKHVAFYLKGMRNAKQTVIAVAQSANLAFTEEAVNKFFIENSSYRTVTDD